ncbi:MAG TPA: hypothetical protein VMG35_29685, partial [Bryobacteraceae bacterium]|nr:hypothetical protein [Bryobacteraceae bacterium]
MNGGPQIPTRDSPGPPKTFLGRWLCARSEIEARGLQVLNGVTGFLVHSPEGAAHRALELLGDAELR